MKRRSLATAVVLVALVIVVASAAVRHCAGRRSMRIDGPAADLSGPVDRAALERWQRIPFYGSLVRADTLRSCRVDPRGTLRVSVDVRAVVAPRLAALGLTDAALLLPVSARGTIDMERPAGTAAAHVFRESWSFDGPAAVFDLFDRDSEGKTATHALDAIPGAPSAVVCVRLMPARLADPALGGAAFASWRDRVSFAEKLLGRPLRAEIAEDLAGPAVFALYETRDAPEAVLAIELRRSDRIAGLLDTLFGLGALTERVTVRRYRGVPTASFRPESGGPGAALAVDGPLLVVATSRARLEATIDARRAPRDRRRIMAMAGDPAASWSAVSESAFVAHGWARLAREGEAPKSNRPKITAALRPEGAAGWRLEGHGPGPALTADPVLPFLRSVFEARQRDGG